MPLRFGILSGYMGVYVNSIRGRGYDDDDGKKFTLIRHSVVGKYGIRAYISVHFSAVKNESPAAVSELASRPRNNELLVWKTRHLRFKIPSRMSFDISGSRV